MNVSAVMESSIDGRAAAEDFLQSQHISDPPGDLGQREEPVIVHIKGSPQPPSASQFPGSPAIRKILIDFLPVNYSICHLAECCDVNI